MKLQCEDVIGSTRCEKGEGHDGQHEAHTPPDKTVLWGDVGEPFTVHQGHRIDGPDGPLAELRMAMNLLDASERQLGNAKAVRDGYMSRLHAAARRFADLVGDT